MKYNLLIAACLVLTLNSAYAIVPIISPSIVIPPPHHHHEVADLNSDQAPHHKHPHKQATPDSEEEE